MHSTANNQISMLSAGLKLQIRSVNKFLFLVYASAFCILSSVVGADREYLRLPDPTEEVSPPLQLEDGGKSTLRNVVISKI
jgi:hypothetical protein